MTHSQSVFLEKNDEKTKSATTADGNVSKVSFPSGKVGMYRIKTNNIIHSYAKHYDIYSSIIHYKLVYRKSK